MVFTNYKRYIEAVNHINQEWKNGCQCGICKTVDKQENIRFDNSRKK